MLWNENPLWRAWVGAVTGLVMMATFGTPVLATGLANDAVRRAQALPNVNVKVPVGDFPREGAGTLTGAPLTGTTGRRNALLVGTPGSQKSARGGKIGALRLAVKPGDIDMMAHLVQAEAESEPYAGKVAVAAVIINRVQSGRFPHSVYGVTFDPDAFESVSNGWYWNAPSQSAYNAVWDALRGWDPSGGALFFFNPAKTNNWYIWSRPIITQIGGHIFSR
ncbi:MAG: cell wall hydrolase [Chitinophagales bacterium]